MVGVEGKRKRGWTRQITTARKGMGMGPEESGKDSNNRSQTRHYNHRTLTCEYRRQPSAT